MESKNMVALFLILFAAVSHVAEGDGTTHLNTHRHRHRRRSEASWARKIWTGAAYACAAGGGTGNVTDLSSLPFCDAGRSIEERVEDLISRMTLQEKVAQLGNSAAGVARLGVPPYEWWSEALHGVSNVGPGTAFSKTLFPNANSNGTSQLVPSAVSFPQVILTAASFNTSLFRLIGQAVSTEARAMYNLAQSGLTFWSPNINIFRDPRWGRGQETPGEDPLLASLYGTHYVQGLQQPIGTSSNPASSTSPLKVAACCKHYTAYDLDNWKGYDRFHFNAIVTDQDMDDTYQPPFKACVRDGNAACIMCSYNRVNGVPTCADPKLLKGVVRGQWGLNGYIASDCDSVEVLYNSIHYTQTPVDAVADSIKAGLNLDCGTYLPKYTAQAVAQGKVTENDVDQTLVQLYTVLMRLGFFDGNPSTSGEFSSLGASDVCSSEHMELAIEAARQGIVLLKNSNGSLPLSSSSISNLAVIGPNANVTSTMIGNYAGVPCDYITPLQGLAQYVTNVTYVAGCANVACSDDSMVSSAVAAAEVADAVVLVMGLDQSQERESLDRTALGLPGQQEKLIREVSNSARGPVILVIMSGGPVDVSFAVQSDSIRGMLWVGYPGQAGGQAIAEVLFGDHNPGGKLPMSWYPNSYTAIPMTDMRMRPDSSTGYPGRTYRFYTGPTLFKFGYGLSYTSFSQSLSGQTTTLALSSYKENSQDDSSLISRNDLPCDNLHFDLQGQVTNNGSLPGTHVALLFWQPPSTNFGAPSQQLVAFRRLGNVQPGQIASVNFRLNACEHLSFTHPSGDHVVPIGLHTFSMGESTQTLSVS